MIQRRNPHRHYVGWAFRQMSSQRLCEISFLGVVRWLYGLDSPSFICMISHSPPMKHPDNRQVSKGVSRASLQSEHFFPVIANGGLAMAEITRRNIWLTYSACIVILIWLQIRVLVTPR